MGEHPPKELSLEQLCLLLRSLMSADERVTCQKASNPVEEAMDEVENQPRGQRGCSGRATRGP